MNIESDEQKSPEPAVHIMIGEEEWRDFSFENKLQLLYRLKQVRSELCTYMAKTLDVLVEEDRAQRTISVEKTLKYLEENNNLWLE